MIAGVPYDAEVEYLESTGTQWIDTGILTSQTLSLETHFDNTGSTTDDFVYGVRSGAATITCASARRFVFDGYARWGNGAFAAVIPHGDCIVKQRSANVVVNGTSYNYNLTQTVTSATGYTIALFAGRDSITSVTFNFHGKIFYFKITDDSTIVRDLIPVRVGSGANAVGYMYDRVTCKLFGNAGTGAFVLGPDVATPVMGLHFYEEGV